MGLSHPSLSLIEEEEMRTMGYKQQHQNKQMCVRERKEEREREGEREGEGGRDENMNERMSLQGRRDM